LESDKGTCLVKHSELQQGLASDKLVEVQVGSTRAVAMLHHTLRHCCQPCGRTFWRHGREANRVSCYYSKQQRSSWDDEDDWGLRHEPTIEDDLGDYFSDNSPASQGYELVGGALAIAVIASFCKVLWYLGIVCYSLVATALQYSVVAVALVTVVIFFG
jgi:hypothetical protein